VNNCLERRFKKVINPGEKEGRWKEEKKRLCKTQAKS
jgi:hypothetical protein